MGSRREYFIYWSICDYLLLYAWLSMIISLLELSHASIVRKLLPRTSIIFLYPVTLQIQNEGYYLQLGAKDALLNALLLAAKRFSSGPPQVLHFHIKCSCSYSLLLVIDTICCLYSFCFASYLSFFYLIHSLLEFLNV